MQVDPVEIASSLVVLMLIPLGAGLLVKARYDETAAWMQPKAAQVSSTALVFLVVLMLVLNVETLISVIGTGVLAAFAVLIAVSFGLGWALGGSGTGTQSVLALGTAQRNVSAALVVGATMMGLLVVVAGELGKRTTRSEPVQMEEATDDD